MSLSAALAAAKPGSDLTATTIRLRQAIQHDGAPPASAAGGADGAQPVASGQFVPGLTDELASNLLAYVDAGFGGVGRRRLGRLPKGEVVGAAREPLGLETCGPHLCRSG